MLKFTVPSATSIAEAHVLFIGAGFDSNEAGVLVVVVPLHPVTTQS